MMDALVYKMTEGSLQERFANSRAKIQVMAGGFANGKTSASVVLKCLPIARDYPGANILMARSTYPKLNDTLRKEFLKWCPKHWIKSFPKGQGENVCTLTNGTTINFRYISQQGKSAESSTSNLLSANYDLIVVDQMEDPEIVEKDFLDLLGRLRGMARYVGTDPTMPRSGPRWMVLTANPTRNWFYRKLVRPLHIFGETGRRVPELLVDPKNGQPLIELFEGSTYENKDNLEADFIETLETAYKGTMRERFLLGKWGAYEGLVYPQYDDQVHILPHDKLVDYYHHLLEIGVNPQIIEGYDHGLAVQSCYLWGFADHRNNVFIVDGYYEKETAIADHASMIKEIRTKYKSDRAARILADPSLFRRTPSGDNRVVGKTVAAMFQEEDIHLTPGNNDKINGIHKVQQYLTVQTLHAHPIFKGEADAPIFGAPHIYFSDKLDFIQSEFNDYYWKKDTAGQVTDEPVDRNDHAMDTLKYVLSRRPKLAVYVKKQPTAPPAWTTWQEFEGLKTEKRSARYG
jgi:hypothetical protein